ncbi:MAG: 4Fe-4S dicluster domain-containing protein [Chloroflexi bacterium]|nr:4Fe-4S dicluster domain-containing protein [Chloroflexota bacterium]
MKITTRGHLQGWLDGLAKRFTLIAPTTVEEQILYRPLGDSSAIAWDFAKTDLSAKEYFIPSTQVLFSLAKEGKGVRLEEPPLEGERILFGLRPCDARALRVLDALFLNKEPVDPYYAQRREKTILIGLACREMGEECFCTSLGLSPDEASDVDLMLTETEEGYAVEAVSRRGREILGDLSLKEVEGTPPKPFVREGRISPLGAEAWPQHFTRAYWARLSDRCLSCRLCTYVCPTCRCFDVRDEGSWEEGIERLSAWDSCMAEGYRRIAGGYNPRPTKMERLRNRFYCKFCYYPQDFGPVACVGCGRCIAKCPVNVDVVEVLQEMATW